MLRVTWLACGLCLTGCWVTADEISQKQSDDSDTDTGPVLEELEILSVAPQVGSNGGGTEVEIETTMLGAEREVELGGRIAPILDVTGNIITITVPRNLDLTGWADIVVRSGGREAIKEQAFHLWPDGTGKRGALGAFQYFTNYDELGDTETGVVAQMGFVEPTEFHTYQFWAPGMDQCVRDYTVTSSAFVDIDTGASWLEVQSGTHTVSIPAQTGNLWFENVALGGDNFFPDASYDLKGMTSDYAEWPVESMPAFFQTPAELEVSSPDLGSFSANISRSTELRWDTSGAGDFVLVRILRYQGLTSPSLAEVVTCVLEDDGAYNMSSSVYGGWSTLSAADVAIGRAKTSKAVLSHNGSDSDILGVQWIRAWVSQF